MENTQLSVSTVKNNNKEVDIIVKTSFDKLPELLNDSSVLEFKKISFNKNSVKIKF